MPLLAVPQSLDKEISKSVYLLREFTANSSSGPDKLIPSSVFAKAKGIAIISYTRMGFFVSARGGSGIVVAKLPNGGWSAPSAVGIAGLGGGLDFGAEVTAIIMMLMYNKAVKAFMKGRNLALGGSISVAAGPVGRMLEGDVALKSPAAMYTYAKSKGLFVGINLSGTCILERRKANEKFYGSGVRAYDLLSGSIPPVGSASKLYTILDELSRNAKRKAFKQAVNIGSKAAEKKYGIKNLNKYANSSADKALAAEDKYHTSRESSNTRDYGNRRDYSSNTRDYVNTHDYSRNTNSSGHKTRLKTSLSGVSSLGKSKSNKKNKAATSTVPRQSIRRAAPAPPLNSSHKGPAPRPSSKGKAPPRPSGVSHAPLSRAGRGNPARPPQLKQSWGEAMHQYTGEMTFDLCFKKGDRIEILTRTPCEFDWWEGRLNGKTGIFPANYIKVIS